MKYLFLFTIPSVQQFISQARKTHDLWAGSQIFNELIQFAAKDLFVDKFGGELIFPVKEAEQFTNRFLGFWEDVEKDKLKLYATEIEKKVKEQWWQIALKSVKNAEVKESELPNGFKEQIESAFEIKWAIVEFNDENYKEKYQEIERIIGGLKNARNFSQYHYQKINGQTIYGERGRKCSVDGIRNVKFYSKKEDDNIQQTGVWTVDKFNKNTKPDWLRYTDQVYIFDKISQRYLAPGEGLSAVSFVKRTIKYPCETKKQCSFSSTAEIALMHNNKNDEFFKKLAIYKSLFERNNFGNGALDYFDYHFLFDENLNIKQISNSNQLKQIRDYYNKELKNIIDLRKYYAVVVFDGDSMGKHLGERDLKSHKELSKKLSEFSKEVRSLDKDYLVKTAYSGGDDYLAFVNLDDLFDVLKEVRKIYQDKLGKEFTISAGIAIAHYKAPLQMVIREAREALEGKAKKVKGKDAVAFTVIRRSGEKTSTVWKWEGGDRLITDFIGEIKALIDNEKISKSFIGKYLFSLNKIYDDKLKVETQDFNVFRDLLVTEFYRVLNKTNENKFSKDKFQISDIINFSYSDETFDFSNYIGLLNLIDFITRKIKSDE